jgi:hypothetical protein
MKIKDNLNDERYGEIGKEQECNFSVYDKDDTLVISFAVTLYPDSIVKAYAIDQGYPGLTLSNLGVPVENS